MSAKMQQSPSLPWRLTSSMVMGLTAALSRGFLYGLNSVEVIGLQRFLDLLDSRKDVEKRQRGLITVSNHVGVLDDPLIWGVLPLRYGFAPRNHRWGLGAHDICFKNRFLGAFFTAGQVLPTYRMKHSPYGGLFQPTMTRAIRLLSDPSHTELATLPDLPHQPTADAIPLTSSSAPGSWNRHGWVHIFPEGCVHQHPSSSLRYFKWGVSRLVLESGGPGVESLPDVVPMFVDGSQHIMPEDRKWPRFAPRFGARVRIAFGEPLDSASVFGDLKTQWDALVESSRATAAATTPNSGHSHGQEQDQALSLGAERSAKMPPGDLAVDDLRYGAKAVEIRVEVARRMRDEVLRVRRSLGYPDEDPDSAFGLAETWAEDRQLGARGRTAKDYKSKVDDSLIGQG